MRNLFPRLLTLTAALLLTVSSCTKTPTEPDQPTATATLDKTTAVPGEIVTITTSETLENKVSWDVTLGGQTVVLARLGDKQALFVVPVLPSGTTSLDLTAVGVKEGKPLTIGQYTAIQNPGPVYADFKTKLDAAVTQMEQLATAPSYPVSAQNLAVFKNMQQSLPAAYTAATADQKLEAAYFLRQLTFTPLDFTTLAERPATASDDPSEQFMNIGRKFVQQNRYTVIGVAVLSAGLLASSPLLAIGGGAFALYHLNQSLKAEETLIDRIGVVFGISDYANRSTKSTAGTLQLTNGVSKNIRIEATYRTMQATDAQGGAFLQEMTGGVNELKQARIRLQAAIDLMKPVLMGSAVTLAPFTDVKTQAATATRYLLASGVLIGNVVTPTDIALSATAQPGEVVTLRATSSTVATVTPFTFDATYIHVPLGVNVRKTFNAEFTPSSSTVTDIDGNVYNIVQIGTQRWLKENLRTSRYRNGDAITTGLNPTAWYSASYNNTTGAYAYPADDVANNATMGKLYNGNAVRDSRGICPQGWHIPSNADWTTLNNYLGGNNVAGGKMKSTVGWKAPNSGATNSSNFTALAVPTRDNHGDVYPVTGESTYFYSSTIGSSNADQNIFELDYDSPAASFPSWLSKVNGLSCRCTQD